MGSDGMTPVPSSTPSGGRGGLTRAQREALAKLSTARVASTSWIAIAAKLGVVEAYRALRGMLDRGLVERPDRRQPSTLWHITDAGRLALHQHGASDAP